MKEVRRNRNEERANLMVEVKLLVISLLVIVVCAFSAMTYLDYKEEMHRQEQEQINQMVQDSYREYIIHMSQYKD